MRLKFGKYELETEYLGEDQWYWHLYRDGIKINGGLNDSEEAAMYAAGIYRRRSERDSYVTYEYAGKRGERI